MTTRHNFARLLFTAMSVSLLLIASFFTTFPVSAISGAVISFTGDGGAPGTTCSHTILYYRLAFTGTTNDSGGYDWIAVMELDGNGTIHDNRFIGLPVGESADDIVPTHLGTLNGAVVDARPIYVRLIDIGDISGIASNTPAGIALALAGTVKASDSFDPALINPACASLPYYADTSNLFNDGRINKEAQATVVAYCNSPEAGDIEVYAIHQSKGYFAFTATKEEIAAIPAKPAVHTLIEQALGAQLWRLTNGNLEIRRGADDNKVYAYQWSGC